MRTVLYKVAWHDKIGYGAGNFGFGIVFQLISSYLVFYGTAVHGINGSLIGLAVGISVFWDAVTDPLMGYISDNTQFKRFGRRHAYLLFGSVGIAFFNYLLWTIDTGLAPFIKFVFLTLCVLLVKTFMTVYATPYTALGAELSEDYNERTSIQSWKSVFFLTGLALAIVMGMYLFFEPTADYPIGQLNPRAYRGIGITSSAALLVFGLLCYFSTRKYIPQLPKLSRRTESKGVAELFKDFAKALNNYNYKWVVLGYLFTNISSALIGTLGLHVFTYTFILDNSQIALVFGVQFLMSIVFQPVWVAVSRKLDKKPTVLLGLAVSTAGSMIFLLLVFLRDKVQGEAFYLLPFSIITGIGIGGLFSLPLSMVADTIDVEELNTGIRTEGVYYGSMTLFYKLSQAIAFFVLGILLDVINFDPELKIQPDITLATLGLVVPLGGVAAFTLAMLAYSRYNLDREQVEEIQEKLRGKREQQ